MAVFQLFCTKSLFLLKICPFDVKDAIFCMRLNRDVIEMYEGYEEELPDRMRCISGGKSDTCY